MQNRRMDDVLRRIEEEEREQRNRAWWPVYLLGLVILGGIGTAAFITYRKDKASGDVVLPAALGHRASAARQDLGLHIRDLLEIAQEADRKLQPPGPLLEPLAATFRRRLVHARETGRLLEPQVTREEGRVLMAATSAAKRLEKFVNGATSALTYKHEDVEVALRQLDRARKLASGDEAGASALETVPILGMAAQVKSVTSNLAEIKKAQETLKKVQSESFKDLDVSKR